MLSLLFLILLFLNPLTLPDDGLAEEPHKDCLQCHKEKDSKELRPEAGLNELCLRCHPYSTQRDHPVNLKAVIKPLTLPLDSDDRITCITCHEPHGKTKEKNYLRLPFNTLCRECHKIY